MDTILSIALVIAEGRGESPGGIEGPLLIAGIVLVAVALGFLGHRLVDRFGRTKRQSLERRPQPPGRVGRAGKRSGP